jgi:hypothetical protein
MNARGVPPTVISIGLFPIITRPESPRFQAFSEIVKLAQQKNLVLQIDYMWRYHPAISKALEAARSGRLGQVNFVQATIATQIAETTARNWRASRAESCSSSAAMWSTRWCDLWANLKGSRPSCARMARITIICATIRSRFWSGIKRSASCRRPRWSPLHRVRDRSSCTGRSRETRRTVPERNAEDTTRRLPPVCGRFRRTGGGDARRGRLRITPDEDLKVERALLACGGMARHAAGSYFQTSPSAGATPPG